MHQDPGHQLVVTVQQRERPVGSDVIHRLAPTLVIELYHPAALGPGQLQPFLCLTGKRLVAGVHQQRPQD